MTHFDLLHREIFIAIFKEGIINKQFLTACMRHAAVLHFSFHQSFTSPHLPRIIRLTSTYCTYMSGRGKGGKEQGKGTNSNSQQSRRTLDA